ncbi:glycoside hydrolase family 17 protein [Pleomassaria siparia CBS 279.74]|uniref:glucan endo-1,3-beta-D-glucosidase n=1 Tax=Pleomassaria siparia CBS 279.74 TaxID=1314801 RepID=A0A6G1KRM2_9PLEO|nr:glycoside hydrolase family 17 protein [Pleomassaria siparia CBS 279.74]
MATPERNFSFNRDDDRTLQPGYQAPPYNESTGDVSPIQAHPPPFPLSGKDAGPPPPPVHRGLVGMNTANPHSQRPYPGSVAGSSNNYSDYSPPGVTPGADNLGKSAVGGGISGIAVGVANTHDRESGLQALSGLNGWGRSGDRIAGPRGVPQDNSGTSTPFADQYASDHPMPRPSHQQSYGPNLALPPSAMAPSGIVSSSSSERSFPASARHHSAYAYSDSPYNQYSSSNLNLAPQLGIINPHELADDDDWGMGPRQTSQQKRRSFVPFVASRDGSSRDKTPPAVPLTAAAAGGAVAGATTYAATRDDSGNYSAVPGASDASGGAELVREKSRNDWMEYDNRGRKKQVWIVGAVIVLVIVGAVVGGALGSVLHKKQAPNTAAGGQTAGAVSDDNKEDLNIKSSEIQALMNNKNLHKVFPGMDYTPLNTQYPDCLTVGASQNNVTRDIAVLSQLTNAVRLYGTDCNQTEMVLHAIDRLELTDMKVWLGVWLGDDNETNTRQVAQMWTLIDDHGGDKFKGVIVGNEVLFRKDLTQTQLLKYITDIKSNLTKHSIDLPVATSDLGDNWTGDLATKVDVVMSNVHPFFAGVDVKVAAGWTWNFWQTHDVVLTTADTSIKQIIAEVGWPSGGGKDCGTAPTCTSTTAGSVAGIDEMNSFMDDWVCQAMKNGTDYFWFEAFDEPWKIRYNEDGKEWEDKWGLMDVNRNLKPGVKIPDCGGLTAS